jgi:hypothetical protein
MAILIATLVSACLLATVFFVLGSLSRSFLARRKPSHDSAPGGKTDRIMHIFGGYAPLAAALWKMGAG